jgi:hypothetical protein
MNLPPAPLCFAKRGDYEIGIASPDCVGITMTVQVRLILVGMEGLLRCARDDDVNKVNLFWDCSAYDKIHSHCEDPDEIGRRSNPSLTCQDILIKTFPYKEKPVFSTGSFI